MNLKKNNLVYLCVWSGETAAALDLVRSRYPEARIQEFPQRLLRVGGFMERIRLLHGLRGHATVFYFQSLAEFKHARVFLCLHFLHRCRQTVLCDGDQWQSMRGASILRTAPRELFRILLDLKTVTFWWCYLKLLLRFHSPAPSGLGSGVPEIAYLIPSTESLGSHGGAMSHVRGFLYALKNGGRRCRVFGGTPLAQEAFVNEVVAPPQRPYFFWEAAMLRYNFVFVQGVNEYLGSARPRALYQRHCRFAVGGALLSRRLRVPLILEYNGPQGWIADHWDPTPFKRLVRLCEEVTLRSASRIVVVSEASRAELLARNISADRIRVNPNGVDADFFSPGGRRAPGRKRLFVAEDEVLVGFVGSFSFWHGIEVLQQAIVELLGKGSPCRLRFVLVGDGLLQGEMRSALAAYEKTGAVIFTGSVAPEVVAEYLDASDILVSPHVPMPDGSRFFGSPTKLFEYMAMGKGIVASRLEQLADVLEHDRTAWLVTPGDPHELAEGIMRLALAPQKRASLGAAARRAAVECHSWTHNVASALDDIPLQRPQPGQDQAGPEVDWIRG